MIQRFLNRLFPLRSRLMALADDFMREANSCIDRANEADTDGKSHPLVPFSLNMRIKACACLTHAERIKQCLK